MPTTPKLCAEMANNRYQNGRTFSWQDDRGNDLGTLRPIQLHVPIVTLLLFHNLFSFTVLFCSNNRFIFLPTNLTSFSVYIHSTFKKQFEMLSNCFNCRNCFIKIYPNLQFSWKDGRFHEHDITQIRETIKTGAISKVLNKTSDSR